MFQCLLQRRLQIILRQTGRRHELRPLKALHQAQRVQPHQRTVEAQRAINHADIGEHFRTGDAAGSAGTFVLTGGQDIVNTGTFFVGQAGTGEFTIDDDQPGGKYTLVARSPSGEFPEARKHFKLAIKEFPNEIWANFALDRLEEIESL